MTIAPRQINKSLATSILAAITVIVGYLTPVYRDQILSVGLFALSGAITNWLAIHMLFEKVPFLYGSGVIPDRFEEFKTEIRSLIMNQFFTEKNLSQFLETEQEAILSGIDLDSVVNALDYDELFKNVVEAMLRSPLGSMLEIVGGRQALEPAREPFTAVFKSMISEVANSASFRVALENNMLSPEMSGEVRDKVEDIIDQRLDELTPQMVKEIVQDMIQQHLGWLVVWGGVFGGLIGFVTSLMR